MNKEMAIKLVRKEIECKREFANKAESLCEVVKKFDGKVFNKRLETAMKEVYPIHVEQEYFWKSISITGWIPDRMVQSDSVDKWGYHETAYIKDDRIYVGIIRDAFNDDKRIIAETIIKAIRSTAEYYKESADKLEEQIGRIDEIIAERDRIYAEKQRFLHNTSGTLREYFGLEV